MSLISGSVYKAFVVSFALTVWIFSLGGSANGQNVNHLAITVKDSNGAIVSGSSVTVTGRDGMDRTVQTGPDGIAKFEGLDAGEYKVSVEAKGFPAKLVTTTVADGNANALDVELVLGAISETVTVTAARTEITLGETPVPVTVVGREEIDRKALNTVGDLFRTLPGTSTTNEGAFQVRPRIRGLESNRVLILVDGERLNNSRTSTGQSGVESGLVETSQIESVEVVRGSGSVLYGTDALAGTINIITKDTPPRRDKGFRFGAVLDTFYTSNETGRRGNLAVNGSGKYFAFRVAQSLERFDNYFTGDPTPADVDRLRDNSFEITDEGEALNSASHGGNTQATARFFLNDTNTFKFNYERRRAADIGSAGLAGTFTAFFPFSNRDKFNVRYDVAALTENLQRISVKAFYQTQDRNFTNILTIGPIPPFFPGFFQFSETVTDTRTAGFDLQSDWVFGRNNLIAGTSFFRDTNSDRRHIVSAATPTSPNPTIRNSRSVPDASLSNIAFFAQDEFRVNNRLRLVGGVRYDRFKTVAEPTPEFTIDPRLTQDQIDQLGLAGLADGLDVANSAFTGDFGAVFTVTHNINLSARIGRSFRTPNISERFFTDPGSAEGFLVGNPSLVPETGTNFDASVKFHTKRISGSATYFNNYYKNFLATTFTGLELQPNGTDIFQTRNIRSARIQGFEAEVEAPFKISLGYLTPYGNFSYLRGDDLTDSEPLDFISPFRTNVGFRWQNFGKNYYFDYNTRIVTQQTRLSEDFLTVNDGPEEGFVSHNIGGGYHFRQERFNVSINVGVSNLFNHFYSEQFVFAPARGRSFTIGTTWEIR
jgi:TonB-dependent heme/hemoglobin receptor